SSRASSNPRSKPNTHRRGVRLQPDTSARSAGLIGLYLHVEKHFTHDGGDITGAPFEMNSGDMMSDVQVVVTNKATTVAGQLADDKGAPITDATVIVFGSDADTWTQGRFIRATPPDQQGQWRIKSLPPGEFLAVAVDYLEDGQWNDPEYLESVRRYGQKLTLADA